MRVLNPELEAVVARAEAGAPDLPRNLRAQIEAAHALLALIAEGRTADGRGSPDPDIAGVERLDDALRRCCAAAADLWKQREGDAGMFAAMTAVAFARLSGQHVAEVGLGFVPEVMSAFAQGAGVSFQTHPAAAAPAQAVH